MRALERNCTCRRNEQDEITHVCPGHAALENPRVLNGLTFANQIADTLTFEEWMVDLKDAMRPRVVVEEPEVYLTSEYAWSVLREMEARQ